MSTTLRNITFWLVVLLLFLVLAKNMAKQETPKSMGLVEVINLGKERTVDGKSRIAQAQDKGGVIKGKFYVDKEGKQTKPFETSYNPYMASEIYKWLTDNQITGYENKRGNDLLNQIFLSALLPILFFFVIWMLVMRQFQSGSNKALSFGKSKAKLVTEGQIKITFEDVAGIDEVKDELTEIIHFLKDPKKFSRLGAKIPKGALLYGPPGTGKTLIARAVAGEAGVPFFSISGSDFVEMFVGVGASRVRDLFEQGKKAKPCVIFIDEIDAVGRHRFAGIGGGHDEREQTLNQLLVELDGFAPNEGIIVMAATNRPDVLDPALLRPGRFDRQIRVDLPDLVGREKILGVHTRALKMVEGVSLRQIAKGTPGFSGADLANLANEAALLAARRNKGAVDMSDLEEAKDRVMMGPERRSMVLNEKERRITAYHEAGHALVAKFTPGNENKVHKVTIIPRGRSLGLTAILPEEELHNQSRQQLQAMLSYAMGGRAAEEIVFSELSTGASNDLSRSTDLAHRMVCEYGMSDKLGPRTFGEPSGQVFTARDMNRDRNYSEETAATIDQEIQDILSRAYNNAKNLLIEGRENLDRVAQALLDRESLDGEELDKVMAGETLPPLFREDRNSERQKPQKAAEDEKESSPVFHPRPLEHS